jgi:CBS domain-containing protein
VARVLRPVSEFLPAEITVAAASSQIRSSRFRSWLVVDNRGVIALVNRAWLSQAEAQAPDRRLGDLLETLNFPHVHSDQSLEQALERMGAHDVDVLPVVNRANIHQLEGVVTLEDVLRIYGISRNDEDLVLSSRIPAE